ncbi:hypothetical protein BKA66DRAFT_440742 [Pyrenochaeta sp. MPI-SDFR-AT-0127]|nr:hypothetical protein BKA66DRAFT_440742 [Pyrenochaeta sp. MPI-SDFR-AT-0127]
MPYQSLPSGCSDVQLLLPLSVKKNPPSVPHDYPVVTDRPRVASQSHLFPLELVYMAPSVVADDHVIGHQHRRMTTVPETKASIPALRTSHGQPGDIRTIVDGEIGEMMALRFSDFPSDSESDSREKNISMVDKNSFPAVENNHPSKIQRVREALKRVKYHTWKKICSLLFQRTRLAEEAEDKMRYWDTFARGLSKRSALGGFGPVIENSTVFLRRVWETQGYLELFGSYDRLYERPRANMARVKYCLTCYTQVTDDHPVRQCEEKAMKTCNSMAVPAPIPSTWSEQVLPGVL